MSFTFPDNMGFSPTALATSEPCDTPIWSTGNDDDQTSQEPSHESHCDGLAHWSTSSRPSRAMSIADELESLKLSEDEVPELDGEANIMPTSTAKPKLDIPHASPPKHCSTFLETLLALPRSTPEERRKRTDVALSIASACIADLGRQRDARTQQLIAMKEIYAALEAKYNDLQDAHRRVLLHSKAKTDFLAEIMSSMKEINSAATVNGREWGAIHGGNDWNLSGQHCGLPHQGRWRHSAAKDGIED